MFELPEAIKLGLGGEGGAGLAGQGCCSCAAKLSPITVTAPLVFIQTSSSTRCWWAGQPCTIF